MIIPIKNIPELIEWVEGCEVSRSLFCVGVECHTVVPRVACSFCIGALDYKNPTYPIANQLYDNTYNPTQVLQMLTLQQESCPKLFESADLDPLINNLKRQIFLGV